MTHAAQPDRAPPQRRMGARLRAHRGLGATLAVVLIAVLIALPLLTLLSAATADSQGLWRHLADTVLGDYVSNTLLLALGVVAVAGSIGTICAWLVAVYRFPGARLFAWALVLPLAFPAYILAFLYTDLLQYAGPVQSQLRAIFGWQRGDYWFPDIYSLYGAALVLGLTLYPYVFTLARVSFAGQSAGAIEAARTLGRRPSAIFFTVVLPMARPALVAGCALCVMESLADFGAVSYFAIDTFTVGIYRAWYALDNKSVAAQLALALLGLVLLALLIERFSRSPGIGAKAARSGRPLAPIQLQGWRALLACAACAAPLVFGFLLPVAWLVRLALASAPEQGWARLGGIALNTGVLALIAACVTVTVAAIAAWSARHASNRFTHIATRAAMVGYATPGVVIAVGLLLAISLVDRWIDRASLALLGSGTGLVLAGTLVAVVYGLSCRFFAVGFGAVDAGFARIGANLDASARVLGQRPFGVLRRVHLPLLRPHLATALILVAADALKELPATMILRPFNFDTLAVEVFRAATTERLDAAALPALMIVAVSLVPVLLLSRQMRQRGLP